MKLRTKFQDKDFKLGEVVDASIMYGCGDKIEVYCTEKSKLRNYNSIKDFTDNWEDAPEEYWYVSCDGRALKATTDQDEYNEKHNSGHVSIGNHFSSREEAEKAVEKLKAWKRLKSCKFRFERYTNIDNMNGNYIVICANIDTPHNNLIEDMQPNMVKDLDLLFGGEE